jgi:hypothetical protein
VITGYPAAWYWAATFDIKYLAAWYGVTIPFVKSPATAHYAYINIPWIAGWRI